MSEDTGVGITLSQDSEIKTINRHLDSLTKRLGSLEHDNKVLKEEIRVVTDTMAVINVALIALALATEASTAGASTLALIGLTANLTTSTLSSAVVMSETS